MSEACARDAPERPNHQHLRYAHRHHRPRVRRARDRQEANVEYDYLRPQPLRLVHQHPSPYGEEVLPQLREYIKGA
ncbi:MAG: hypothetical protein ACLTSX_05310 [Collinsella sp.]